MIWGEDLRNLKVVVRDTKTGKTIADTTVRYYNKQFDVIRIDSDGISDEMYSRVEVLLFSQKGSFKCSGTVRGNGRTGEVDIALYNGNEADDRGAVRYSLEMPGVLNMVLRPGEGAKEMSVAVMVLNMSTTGFLFRAPTGVLEKNDIVKINCLFKGRHLALQGEIVRTQNMDIQSIEYGCKLFSVQNVKG